MQPAVGGDAALAAKAGRPAMIRVLKVWWEGSIQQSGAGILSPSGSHQLLRVNRG